LRLYGVTTSKDPLRKTKPIPGAEIASPAFARAGFATLLAMTGVGSGVLRKTKPIYPAGLVVWPEGHREKRLTVLLQAGPVGRELGSVVQNKANSQNLSGGSRGHIMSNKANLESRDCRVAGRLAMTGTGDVVRNKANCLEAKGTLTAVCRKGYGEKHGSCVCENKANSPRRADGGHGPPAKYTIRDTILISGNPKGAKRAGDCRREWVCDCILWRTRPLVSPRAWSRGLAEIEKCGVCDARCLDRASLRST
jgi:hypothetical protein